MTATRPEDVESGRGSTAGPSFAARFALGFPAVSESVLWAQRAPRAFAVAAVSDGTSCTNTRPGRRAVPCIVSVTQGIFWAREYLINALYFRLGASGRGRLVRFARLAARLMGCVRIVVVVRVVSARLAVWLPSIVLVRAKAALFGFWHARARALVTDGAALARISL